jgi:hypothetical protein
MSFLQGIARSITSLIKGFKDPEFQALLFFVAVILGGGTVFYHYVEKWRFLDSFYFSVITLATVGYGDFHPKTDLGKMFTVGYIIVGIGIILGFINAVMRHTYKENPVRQFFRQIMKDEEKPPGAEDGAGEENSN